MAGLAAARLLHASKVDFVLLEARERIGGRIFTLHDESLGAPIELGAEFVHGSAPELNQLAKEAGFTTVDIGGQRWQSARGALRPLGDFWSLLDSVMGRLPARGPDRSFEQFLMTRPGGRRAAHARSFARQYVAGFHAADPERISARALADGGSPGDDVREQRIGRLLGGYDLVPRWLARDIGDRVQFGAIVTRVEWEAGAVRIDLRAPDGRSMEAVNARAAIVALPLGVLLALPDEPGAVEFSPSLASRRSAAEALAGMEMGSVLRVTMQLHERFWTTERVARRVKNQNLDRLSFLHTSDEDFPVWWTTYPLSLPVIVAWCAGPRARELSPVSEDEVKDRAIAALGRQFGLPSRQARRLVIAAWLHNWQTDPYARGAYSYVLVNGSESPAKLARPAERALVFAGEACEPEGRTGTVHGAISSGRRAAKQVLRFL